MAKYNDLGQEREPGFYWVKRFSYSKWKPAHRDGIGWLLFGSPCNHQDSDLYEIGPPVHYDADDRIERAKECLKRWYSTQNGYSPGWNLMKILEGRDDE